MTIYDLTCCRLEKLLAVAGEPRFSWKLKSDRRGAAQTAYRLTIADSGEMVFDSGKVMSADTLDITAEFDWKPYTRYLWTVTAWDERGVETEPSSSFFETGPICEENITAKWVANKIIEPKQTGGPPMGMPPGMAAPRPETATYFRGEFDTMGRKPVRSRLYFAAEKVCYVTLNGTQADAWLTDPMPRNQTKRVLFTTYILDESIMTGKNALGIVAAGDRLLAQLAVTYEGGETQLFGSDDSWRFAPGAIKLMPMESGEDYNAFAEPEGWDTPGFDCVKWSPAIISNSPGGRLEAKMTQPLCVTRTSNPVWVKNIGDGKWLFAAKEMTVGRICFTGSAPTGTRIKINLSEKLNDDGGLFIYNSGFGGGNESMSTSFYTFRGQGHETFAYKLHTTSFQYGEISGYYGEIKPEDIEIQRVASDMKRISSFDCDNELFNTLYENMLRTVENDARDGLGSTFLDEKGAFQTGDPSFAGEGILMSEDISAIIMQNVAEYHDSQLPDGSFTSGDDQDPNGGFLGNGPKKPEWDSTGLYLTKYLDDYAGTKHFTRSQYQTNLDYIRSEVRWMQANDYVENSFFGGDWNSPEGEGSPEGGKISGTACNYRALEYMAEMAGALGLLEDEKWCVSELEKTGDSINKHFLKGDHYETGKTEYFRMWGGPQNWNRDKLLPVGYRQASNIVPLAMGIVPEDKKSMVAERLVLEIHKAGDHLDCGSASIKYLLTGLSDLGYTDLAYDIANQRAWPSWGWWVEQGATTMWEHWLIDSRSRNHFFLGAGFLDWVFKSLAGIKNVKNGFETLTIEPKIPAKPQYASVSIDTPRGMLKVSWKKENGKTKLDVTIPVGTTAKLVFDGASKELTSGTWSV